MKGKKNSPTHSQTLGIIWLSVAFAIAAAAIIFSGRNGKSTSEKDTDPHNENQILAAHEDSVYQSRHNYKSHRKIDYIKATAIPQKDTVAQHFAAPARRQPLVVDLNSADTLTLQLLHGIGPAYARRIVKYRDRLGGFIDQSQLLEVYGFTPDLLSHIAPHLSIDTAAVHQLPINSIGLKQLLRHPYVEYYQARDIVRLRQEGIRFRSADDLRAVPSMTDSTLARLLPYIDFATD